MSSCQITFIEHDGESRVVQAQEGQTLMQAAIDNGVTGIVAECGGARVCGTCHCYLDQPWLTASGEQEEDETMLLEFSENFRPGSSRLSCQIQISKALDGIVVKLPLSQP